MSDYVDAEGVRGFFQLEHCVYQRTGEPCRKCGETIKPSWSPDEARTIAPAVRSRTRGASRIYCFLKCMLRRFIRIQTVVRGSVA